MYDFASHRLSDLTVEQLESLLEKLAGSEATAIAQDSHRAVLQRLIEMSLLSDSEMLTLARYSKMYIGTLESQVSDILERRTGVKDSQASQHIAQMMRADILSSGKKSNLDLWFESTLVEYAEIASELRCFYCGYHFREGDLGANRRQIVRDIGLTLASTMQSGRLRDPWKPATSHWTGFSLDHRLPESSLGSTSVENLVPACTFCNKKKQINRRYAESLAGRAAGAFMTFVGDENFGNFAIGAAVFFRIWRDGHCTEPSCHLTRSETELTAESINGELKWTTLLPWDLQTRCYRHARY